jgi:hypothetical protein
MVPLSWAQLVVGHLPRGGPRLRTPPRSSSQRQEGKEASAPCSQKAQHRGFARSHHNDA